MTPALARYAARARGSVPTVFGDPVADELGGVTVDVSTRPHVLHAPELDIVHAQAEALSLPDRAPAVSNDRGRRT